jgi:hypothetical protein
MQKMRRSCALLSLVLLASAPWLAGCAFETSTEDVGTAEERQIDPNVRGWRSYTMTFDDASHTPFGQIYLFSSTLGSYQPGLEYWYVNRDSLSLLGNTTLSITVTNYSNSVTPTDPGYASEQTFTHVTYPTGGWGTGWTTDPVSGGSLYGGSNQRYVRLKTGGTPLGISNVTWYQVLPSTSTPANITPSGTFSVSTAVSVPTGYLGYHISQ